MAKNARTLCIDVSHWEPAVDWAKAKAAGVQVMHTKASEGLTNFDRSLKMHVESAKKAGVLTGAYHFLHCSMDGAKQADHYLDAVKGMTFDLVHVLDWESGSADGISAAAQKRTAIAYLNRIFEKTGQRCVIYGGESYLRELKLGTEFAKYPLWLAHYGASETRLKVPAPWKDWSMWQYTDSAKIPGLAKGKACDASWLKVPIETISAA